MAKLNLKKIVRPISNVNDKILIIGRSKVTPPKAAVQKTAPFLRKAKGRLASVCSVEEFI